VSLSILSSLPDPLKRVHQLQQEIDDLRNQLEDAQDDLRKERQKTATMERGVSRLREALTPVYSGLQMIFGEIEATGVQGEMASASGLDPRKIGRGKCRVFLLDSSTLLCSTENYLKHSCGFMQSALRGAWLEL